ATLRGEIGTAREALIRRLNWSLRRRGARANPALRSIHPITPPVAPSNAPGGQTSGAAIVARTPRTRRAGVVVATTGLVLAASGLGTGVAGATPKGGDLQITICHATSSVTNPYTVITVSVSAADGGLGKGGNDHSSHTGPVFDFTADPSDPDYPYHPPAKDWGDIIPPFQWDGGSFPGLNWGETGQAVHAAGCAAPAQDPGDEQPGEDPETEDPETEDPETEDPETEDPE